MGMLREFVDYFVSVMTGKRDSLTAFLEPLTMGERYYRWGLENGDLRDFRAGMDYLHLCNDREAPMASLLLRKYNCVSDITSAAIEALLTSHDKVIEAAVKTENDYREERENVLGAITSSKELVRKLQEEGSLIKAKGEERRAGELEENARRLLDLLESGESRTTIFDSYDQICADAQRFFRELDQAAVMVTIDNRLGASLASSLADQLKSRLDYLKERVDKASPVADERDGGKTGTKPAPGRKK